MEQILKNFTLDFFGKGKHKISPVAFFEMDDIVFLDVRTTEEANSLGIDGCITARKSSTAYPER
ncbi:hypothetical protein [Desulfobacula sp.]